MHDGLDAINKETESTTSRQDYLDRKYDEQIKNMTVQDPSSAEIVDMRVAANGKTFKKAGDRLNYFDEQLDKIKKSEIGARNYIRDYHFNSDDVWKCSRAEAQINVKDGHGVLVGTIENPHLYQDLDAEVVKKGDTFTIQYNVKFEGVSANTGTNSLLIRTQLTAYTDTGTMVQDIGIFGKHESDGLYLNEGWHKVVKTITITSDSVFDYTRLRLYARNFTGKIYFKDIKLVRGERITDVMLAEEDIKNSVTKNAIALMSDIDETIYKKGDRIEIGFLISEQLKNYAYHIRKLHLGQLINIICRGDSLTYGYDVTSSNIIEGSIVTDTGRKYTQTKAPKQYPMMLEEYLNRLGCNVKVTNLGYGGAWAKFSYDEFYKKRGDSLVIIELGTNDSRNNSCPYKGDIKKFIEYYEQLIVREILWGNSIILIQPINTRNMRDIDIETFRAAVKMLGDKYCIPVLDGSEFVNNYEYTIWSDGTHLNDIGYSIKASKIASAIAIQDFTQPKEIFGGTILLTRPTLDSCRCLNKNAIYFTASAGYTPNPIDAGKLACRLNQGGEIAYTFYNNVENLVLLPTIYLTTNAKIEFELDFGLPQSKTPLTTANYKYAEWDGTLPNKWILENTGANYSYSKITANKNWIENQPLILANKGFYTLLIKNSSNTTEGWANFFGIEFLTIENWYNLCNRSKSNRLFTNSTGVSEVGAIIELSDNISNYDYLLVYADFFGYRTFVIDYNVANHQYINVDNISDNVSNFTRVHNEIRIDKVDENHLKISTNGTIYVDANGVGSRKTDEAYLTKIRGVQGIKC